MKFKGKRKDFPMWLSQFKALCSVKGVLKAMGPSFKNKSPDRASISLDKESVERLLIEAKAKNDSAMSYLTLSMALPQLLTKIEALKSVDWSCGGVG